MYFEIKPFANIILESRIYKTCLVGKVFNRNRKP